MTNQTCAYLFSYVEGLVNIIFKLAHERDQKAIELLYTAADTYMEKYR